MIKILSLAILSFNSFSEELIHLGAWKGYCDALGSEQSFIGTYTFTANQSGTYKTEFFKGQRCEGSPARTNLNKFTYVQSHKKTDKDLALEMTFEKGPEVNNGKYNIRINGDVLTVRLDGPVEQSGDRQIGYPFNYVREK